MRLGSGTWVVAAAAVLCLSSIDAIAQVKAGPEFRANTYTTGAQERTGVAVEKDGDFVVVWDSTGQDGNLDGAFGQRYDRAGNPRGAEFQANTYTTGSQNLPEVAVNAKGNFVVVWRGAGLQDGSSYGVFGQRYDATGNRAGAEFQVNTYTTGYQGYAHVGMDRLGNFMVVWESAGQDGNLDGVFARRYDARGNPIGAEFQVNTYATGAQETAKIAMHADGRAVVVWESTQDGAGDGIYAQRYDASGNPAGGEFQVNTTTLSTQDEPAVGMAADGSFVVVWEDDGRPGGAEVSAQRFAASGSPVGAEFQVNSYTTGTQFVYGMALDSQGNFVVTWDDLRDLSSFGVAGIRISSANAQRGLEFQVNTYTVGYQGVSNLSSDEAGNYVVAWHSDQDGSGRGVYVQRFGGLFPVALGVDTTGNNVLEPGETVNVAPAWRNHVGAPQTFTGTLTGIAGPAGATYTITDGTANHGTVPDNGTSACGSDCYAVSVSNPNPRPVLHWDASALESIVPDTQGQQKRWLLHVGASFTDVPTSSPFYRFIETLLHHEITAGCNATQYCPSNPTTREQMAVFVLVAKEGVGYAPPACGATPVFADVPPSSPFCRWIEELARRSVVSGCGGGNYCPTAQVTREQMAVFVLRTLDPAINPPACVPPNIYFDVPETSPFCRWIEELTNRGVVSGCGGGNYCPTQPVTREQMAVFIVVTFGLTLYGP